jgi:hypothetical protein
MQAAATVGPNGATGRGLWTCVLKIKGQR